MEKQGKIRKIWTQEYVDALTNLCRVYTDKEIAQIMTDKFGVEFTMVSVRRKRNKLKLKKFGGKKAGIKNQEILKGEEKDEV